MIIAIDVRKTHESLVTSSDTLRPEDRERLRAIFDAVEAHPSRHRRFPVLLRDYYRDKDRADRTPRDLLYLHLGLLLGVMEGP